jgi:hypothetical protein
VVLDAADLPQRGNSAVEALGSGHQSAS